MGGERVVEGLAEPLIEPTRHSSEPAEAQCVGVGVRQRRIRRSGVPCVSLSALPVRSIRLSGRVIPGRQVAESGPSGR